MCRTVTFGEIMLRLSPEGNRRFVQADKFTAHYGGSEANTAVCLSNLGIDASFVTKLPENDLGQGAVNYVRQFGVDVSGIKRGGGRMGLYFLEKGAAQRPSKVVYDRADSAVARAKRADFDWERLLSGADWFHFSGITPALGGELPEICMDACITARGRGIAVSFDLNYRAALWSYSEAKKTLEPLLRYIDVFIANEEQFGAIIGDENKERFDILALTKRAGDNAGENVFAAELRTDGARYSSVPQRVNIVDRVGGGDAFSAGLIYGKLTGMEPQSIVDFAAAAACLKHSVEGDAALLSADEINALIEGGDGRVVR